MAVLFKNNAQTTLAATLNTVSTVVHVASGTGAMFPAPTGGDYFVLTLADAATQTTREILWCTAVVGDTLTVTRAKEGTAALNWAVGDVAALWITAGQMAALSQPGGAAGGSLTGTYPNPTIAADAVVESMIAPGAVGTPELASNAVTNAVLATMAAHTIKGNNTSSTDNAQDITFANLVTALLSFGLLEVLSYAVNQSYSTSDGSIEKAGYLRFQVGTQQICLQWGFLNVVATGEGGHTFNFPDSFSTTCWCALPAMLGDGTSGNDVWAQVSPTPSATSMTIFYQAPNSGITGHGAFWAAIGD